MRIREGGCWLRSGDGVSAAWVRHCERSNLRWGRYIERERRAAILAERIVAISPMVKGELARYYGRDDARVVLNPILSEAAEIEPRARGCAVFVGHGFFRKGLDIWLRACLSVDLPTIVVGRDRRMASWRRRAGISVEFVGAVEASPWIAGAAVVVHPARYEPYGNVIAEAVAARVPVVCSDRCGAATLLHPDAVWAPSEGPAGLAERVLAVLDSPPEPLELPPSAEDHLAALCQALRA